MSKVFVNMCWGRSIDKKYNLEPRNPHRWPRRKKTQKLTPFVDGMEFIHDPLPMGVPVQETTLGDLLATHPDSSSFDIQMEGLNSVRLNKFADALKSFRGISGSGYMVGRCMLDVFRNLFAPNVMQYIEMESVYANVLCDEHTGRFKEGWVRFVDINMNPHEIQARLDEQGGCSIDSKGRTAKMFYEGKIPDTYRSMFRREYDGSFVGYLLSEDEAQDLEELRRMVANDASTGN